MMQIIRRIVELVKVWSNSNRLLDPVQPSLSGLTATVYVREPNGSRTNLEHHIEHELISRGARVLVASQQAGTAMVKQGEFSPLHPEAHFMVVGTLVVKNGIKLRTQEAESDYDYEEYRREHDRQCTYLKSYNSYELMMGRRSYPVLREQRKMVEVDALNYQLSFRLVGKDGALLASGTCEDFPKADLVSSESILVGLAKSAIARLDETDVWSRIVIS